MKGFTSFLIFLIIPSCSFSQADSVKSWVEQISQTIIGIGIDTVDYVKDNNGNYQKDVFGKPIPFRKVDIYGTGVLCYIKLKSNNETTPIPVLVTAKHVFREEVKNFHPSKINLRFYNDKDKGIDKYYGESLNLYSNGSPLWFELPDKNTDLAAIILPANLILNYQATRIDNITFLSNLLFMSLQEAYEGQEIFMVGYPKIVSDKYRTKPIIRRGIISWIDPTLPDNEPFLIDTDIYGGNSGGAIFVNNSITKSGKVGLSEQGNFKFIGIVSQRSNLINQVITSNLTKFYLEENVSLGIIEPASKVRKLLNLMEIEINRK